VFTVNPFTGNYLLSHYRASFEASQRINLDIREVGMKQSSWALILLLLGALLLVGCAPGPNDSVGSADDNGKVAGFWLGLWHGFTVLFTFIVSLFSDSVHIYEVHNNGGWYNFGYLLGVMTFFGSGSQGACRGRRR
jgi:hypothetical protein